MDGQKHTGCTETEDYSHTITGLWRQVAENQSLATILDEALIGLRRLIAFDSATILLNQGSELVIQAAYGLSDKNRLIGSMYPESDYPLIARCLSQNRAVIVPDVRTEADWNKHAPSIDVLSIRGWAGLPVRVKDQIFGILCLDAHQPGFFNESLIAKAQDFADQAALAIWHARFNLEAEKRIRKLSALNNIGQALSGQLGLDSLASTVCASINDIFLTDSVCLVIQDPVQGKTKLSYELVDGQLRSRSLASTTNAAVRAVLDSASPLLIQRQAAARLAELGEAAGDQFPKAWLGVPILNSQGVLGALAVTTYTQEDFFSAEDTDLLATIAGSIAGAMDNARAYAEASDRAHETRVLLEISRELSSSLELDAVLDTITAKAHEILTRDSTAVYLLEAQSRSLAVLSACGRNAPLISQRRIQIGSGIVGAAALHGRPEVVNNAKLDPRAVHIEGSSPDEDGEKIMAIPLIIRNSILGVMVIWRSPEEAEFSDHEVDFCTALANQAAIAIYNAQIYGQAKAARAEAEAASLIKSRFLATMSHELRTPLNSVINFAYLLQEGIEGPLNDGQRDLVERVETSGRYLLSLINDILDLAKIEAGKMELFIEVLDPAAITRETVNLALGLMQDKPIELSVDIPANLAPIHADKTRLRQILLNILSNAVKFTDKGSISIRLRNEDRVVRFEICDTGRGMAPEEIDKAFREFSQLNSSGRERHSGSGLGLSIVKRLVELHRGSIDISSKPGQGTCISFILPQA